LFLPLSAREGYQGGGVKNCVTTGNSFKEHVLITNVAPDDGDAGILQKRDFG
jgi:hypothetical protein